MAYGTVRMQSDELAILFAVVTLAAPCAAEGLGLDFRHRAARRISVLGLPLLLLLGTALPRARIAPALALAITLAFWGVAVLAYTALEPAIRGRRLALSVALVLPAVASVLIVVFTSSRGIAFWLLIGAAPSALGWGSGWLTKAIRVRRPRTP